MKGNRPKEIKAELDEVHGTSAPLFKTVYNCFFFIKGLESHQYLRSLATTVITYRLGYVGRA